MALQFDPNNNAGGFLNDNNNNNYSQNNYDNEDSKPFDPLSRNLSTVSLKQIIDSKDINDEQGILKVDNLIVNQMEVVGKISNINKDPSKTSFTVDDSTGCIPCKLWTNDENEHLSELVIPNTYVRVFGKLNIFGGIRSINVFHLQKITNFNDITYHAVQCLHTHLMNTSNPEKLEKVRALELQQFKQNVQLQLRRKTESLNLNTNNNNHNNFNNNTQNRSNDNHNNNNNNASVDHNNNNRYNASVNNTGNSGISGNSGNVGNSNNNNNNSEPNDKVESIANAVNPLRIEEDLNGVQQEVVKIILKNNSSEGCSVDELVRSCGDTGEMEIRSVLEDLKKFGIVYDCLDEDHWKTSTQ